jgi:hypothetical protein
LNLTTTNDEPLPENIAASFKRLSVSASHLAAASDELQHPVETLDANLRKLGLGVPAWVTVVEGGDPHGNGYYWQHDLGYAKVGSKWGIALRSLEGNVADPEPDKYEEWLFADAPRAMRIQAVDYLGKLLDKLIEEADDTTAKIKGKVGRARTVADAVKVAAAETQATTRGKQK